MTDRFTVITNDDDHTDFYAWLELGKQQGWCSEEVCDTHDLVSMEDWELEMMEEGDDPCRTVVRLYGPYTPYKPATEPTLTVHTNDE